MHMLLFVVRFRGLGGELSLNIILNYFFQILLFQIVSATVPPAWLIMGGHMLPFKKLLTNYNLSNN